MTEQNAAPPPNGFTRGMRRFMAICCLVAFFTLLVLQVMGHLVHDVPTIIYVLLFSGALMMFDQVNEIVKKIGGEK